jgi:hypothetical protein
VSAQGPCMQATRGAGEGLERPYRISGGSRMSKKCCIIDMNSFCEGVFWTDLASATNRFFGSLCRRRPT